MNDLEIQKSDLQKMITTFKNQCTSFHTR